MFYELIVNKDSLLKKIFFEGPLSGQVFLIEACSKMWVRVPWCYESKNIQNLSDAEMFDGRNSCKMSQILSC